MANVPHGRILIVDDEEQLTRALCNTLQEQGYETAGFSSGTVALSELKQNQFDLLLADMMMPEMDGIALLHRASETDHNLVGIIMTGQGTIDSAVQAMKAGAFDYILKPFKLSFILPVLSRALALRRLRLENEELERRVYERTAQLEAANKELESFSYSVSHDLRAPLRHILGFSGMLREDLGDALPENARQNLEKIGIAARNMSTLIDELLRFSKSAYAEVVIDSIDLDHLVEEVLAEFKEEIQQRNVSWNRSPLPKISGDKVLLRQVLVNLFSNALKYTRPRSPAQITVGSVSSEQETVVFVRDNGVGFDPQNSDKLFGVFQRLHSDREFEGTGIGLATVRRIVKRHGGSTWAESSPGEGATFYFSLPKPTPS